MMAEDFAPFNVDVTTVEPPQLASGVSESVANGVALRIAVGGSWQDWYGAPAGGVGYYDVFTNSIANVVYVFSDNTSALFGETSSHEAGHGFGLQHQSLYDVNGVKLEEYYSGTNTWQPIMGGGTTSLSITSIWYNGTNSAGPNSYQDDMAVIARAQNGFGHRADDHVNTLSGATPLSTDGVTWSGSGIIETNADVDVFSFMVTAEDVYRLSSQVADIAPNLDAVLELRNAAGQLLAAAAPVDMKGAEIVQNLLPGTYFLSALKTAAYGWVGQYSLSIDAPEVAIIVAPASYPMITSETGGTVSFTVVLSEAPTADVQISVGSSNAAEGVASTTDLVFTPANWNVAQTVTVNAVDDNVSDGNTAYAIVLGLAVSPDLRFDGLNPADVSVVNIDNDVKFYVVNDATVNTNYRYGADGSALGELQLDYREQRTTRRREHHRRRQELGYRR